MTCQPSLGTIRNSAASLATVLCDKPREGFFVKYALALSLVAISGIAFAGDCGDCASGRQGLFARRAERRAARSSCASSACESSTAKVMEEAPAVIRRESVYKTSKVGERTVIAPAGQFQTVNPAASKTK